MRTYRVSDAIDELCDCVHAFRMNVQCFNQGIIKIFQLQYYQANWFPLILICVNDALFLMNGIMNEFNECRIYRMCAKSMHGNGRMFQKVCECTVTFYGRSQGLHESGGLDVFLLSWLDPPCTRVQDFRFIEVAEGPTAGPACKISN